MLFNLTKCRRTIGVLRLMPGPLRLKLKADQFLDSTTFVIPTKHPPKFIFFSIAVFCFIVLFPSKISKLLLVCIGLFFLLTILYNSLCKLKICLSGDIESNSGPAQQNQSKLFSVCHWNLNSITAHGYAKVSLLKAYITAHKIDICLLETYFDSSIKSDNDNLEIPRYNLVRSDHSSNNKRGGV